MYICVKKTVILLAAMSLMVVGCFKDDECGSECQGDDGSEPENSHNEQGDSETETETDTDSFRCTSDLDCADDDPCNGEEVCDNEQCIGASEDTFLEDGNSCGIDKECFDGLCREFQCQDSYVSSNEQCDDGNDVDGDGCQSDCTWSCEQASDCDDLDICNGSETCDLHVCKAGLTIDCDDNNTCTADSCENAVTGGCVHTLIDNDGDGVASADLGDCGSYNGGDCDDSDDDIHPGHKELCDYKDNDCDDTVDNISDPAVPGATRWYEDCDQDGHSPSSTAGTKLACAEPTDLNCGSEAGWTDNAPGENTDCNDGCSDAYPGQAAYFSDDIPGTSSMDYDCDGFETGPPTIIIPATGCTSDACESELTGWDSSRPACGESGPRIHCETDGDFCVGSNAGTGTVSCH